MGPIILQPVIQESKGLHTLSLKQKMLLCQYFFQGITVGFLSKTSQRCDTDKYFNDSVSVNHIALESDS